MKSPSVLVLSQRKIAHLVAYCVNYEFEDTVRGLTDCDLAEVSDKASLELYRRIYRYTRLVTGSSARAGSLTPTARPTIPLMREYDLFLPFFNHTHEIYGLMAVPDWKRRCAKSACFIMEAWSDLLPEYLIELLSDFDHIFTGCQNAVAEIARLTGRPCTYLPLAADVLRFAPASPAAPRPISVSYIGRRSQITHAALLESAKHKSNFYYYDTVAASGDGLTHRTFSVDNPAEHRILLATLLKRSQFFVANRSYVNRPEFTAGRDEISPRFFEGAASGAILVGEPPRNKEFADCFDWTDAMFHLPFDSADAADRLDQLNSDPDRLLATRRANVRNAAMRHDWVYRLQQIFTTLGLPATPQMATRSERLATLAAAYA